MYVRPGAQSSLTERLQQSHFWRFLQTLYRLYVRRPRRSACEPRGSA